MSDDHKTQKNHQSQSNNEREILELRIDLKLAEAKEALRQANQAELDRIARERPESLQNKRRSGINFNHYL